MPQLPPDSSNDSLPDDDHLDSCEGDAPTRLQPRAEDLDTPYSAFPSINLSSSTYPENASIGLGIRHVRPNALFVFERWAVQNIGDTYELYLGDPTMPEASAVVQDNTLARHFLSIIDERVQRGEVHCHGRVARIGSGTVSTSPAQLILIKTDRPGGDDRDHGQEWHSKLIMSVEGFPHGSSISPGDVATGVWCLIELYEYIRQNDIIELLWDGVLVLHTVSPAQAAGSGPIRVFVSKAVIDQGGQLGTLTLRFRVRDVVDNYSGVKYQYSQAYYLEAELDDSLLLSPLLLVDGIELESGQIDFDTQSNASFTVLTNTAQQRPPPNPRHRITVTLLATLINGSTETLVLETVIDNNFGATFIPIAPEIIARIVGGSFRISFLWHTESGVELGRSGSITIRVVGTPVLMPAPDVKPIELGLIPQGVDITVTIPEYEPHDRDWFETLFIVHTPPIGGGAIVLEQRQLAGDQGGTRTVTAAELAPFNGRDVDIYYETNDGVAHALGGSALTIRQSVKLGARIGERMAVLPAVRLQGVFDNNVNPDDVSGAEVLITFTDLTTRDGDKIHWTCTGSGTNGNANGIIHINAATAGQELPYPVNRRILDNNLNGFLSISYTRERPGPPPEVLHSAVLNVTVGTGVELDRPDIVAATTLPDELDPLAVLAGAKVIVKYRPMRATDQIHVDWQTEDSIGSDTKDVPGNPATNEAHVTFDTHTIGLGIRDHGNTIYVKYRFNRGLFAYESETVPLRLLPLTGLPSPTIDDFPGNILNLSLLNPTARTRVPPWSFTHAAQLIWMTYEGTNADNSPFLEDTYTANEVTDEGVINGINPPTPVYKLKQLRDGSTLTIRFWVNFAQNTDKRMAVLFGVRTYVVQAVPSELERPRFANFTAPTLTVNPLTYEHNASVVVQYGIQNATHRIALHWVYPDGSMAAIADRNGATGGRIDIPISQKILADSVGKVIDLRYVATISGVPVPSQTQTVTVNTIPAASLPRALINGIAHNGLLDLNVITGNLTAAVSKWALSGVGQRVWMELRATGVEPLLILNGYAINSSEAANGLVNKAVMRSWFALLPLDSICSLYTDVTFDGSLDRSRAVRFQTTSYNVRRAPISLDVTDFNGRNYNGWRSMTFREEILNVGGREYWRGSPLSDVVNGGLIKGFSEGYLTPKNKYEISFDYRNEFGSRGMALLVWAENVANDNRLIPYSAAWRTLIFQFTFTSVVTGKIEFYFQQIGTENSISLDNIRVRAL